MMNNKHTPLAAIGLALSAFVAVPAQAAVALPALDAADATAIATWVVAGMGTYFAIKLSPALAAWGFYKIMSFVGRG
ncbi:hypothetical protein N8I74_12245 [Chitiniphilus purpureus]|uniref:Phage coat protein n=1 Tax=Chitiniphilus purpureus TaxID=2981137 RepID=A0ABY6DIA9_9NEIS|nr:hypothetical protein [Chitiniphilus sp. CD1]UXY14089.1 hypothetical protein N8I74_12245 [Chitiniphilus sp. CD1]